MSGPAIFKIFNSISDIKTKYKVWIGVIDNDDLSDLEKSYNDYGGDIVINAK